MKFDRNVYKLNTYRLMSLFQDGGHDVISRNQVLRPGEWTRSVCRRICNSVRQFLIYSTFVHVFAKYGRQNTQSK